MADETIEELTDANFDARVLRSERPVVVAFVASWSTAWQRTCAGFERLEDVFDDFEFDRFVLDVDAHPEAASNYSVTTVPAFLVFVNGRVVGRILGAASREDLVRWLQDSVDVQ